MKILIILSLCFFLELISIATFSQTKRQNIASVNEKEIARIETYCKTVDSFVKQNEKSALIYANISSTEKVKWRRFKSEKARENADRGNNLNENAYVWRKNGKVIGVNFTFQSGSRDWAHFIMHYYRPDGSLAKIDAKLVPFSDAFSNVVTLRTFYFDENGKLLQKTTRFVDPDTKKPVKPNENLIDSEVYIFKKVSKLPFAGLL